MTGNDSDRLIRDISDTALWAANYRALENERKDALFRDPYAARLAGDRGAEIARSMPQGEKTTWAWITRTVLFDRFIEEQVADGVDMIVNLAAGLDARPYRMTLPSSLKWLEVDLPPLLRYKEDMLKDEQPVCALERIDLDLSDKQARRRVFSDLGKRAEKAMVLSEGLLVYLPAAEVASLAEDLAATGSFRRWALELSSPGLLKKVAPRMNKMLGEGHSQLQFAPAEGPGFFVNHGWQVLDVRSMLKTAATLGRLSLVMRLLALLPESSGEQGSTPWAGVCLFGREGVQ